MQLFYDQYGVSQSRGATWTTNEVNHFTMTLRECLSEELRGRQKAFVCLYHRQNRKTADTENDDTIITQPPKKYQPETCAEVAKYSSG